jgi:hypothetical protein
MDEEHLDTSWIDPILVETQSTTCPKSSLMYSVSVSCIFVNHKNEIERVKKENISLDEEDNVAILSEGRLLEIIQRNRCLDDKNKRYYFESMKQFAVTMEPKFLTDFIHNPDTYITNKTMKIPQKVLFPSSVFLYHDVNCLWLLFYEMERVVEHKSIMKQSHIKKRVTKKVRISDILPSRYGQSNKTKRQNGP